MGGIEGVEDIEGVGDIECCLSKCQFELAYPSTFPLIATGLSMIACMPRMADWGGLMMGVPNIEPNTPPFDMVNVPPSMSSMANAPVRAYNICMCV